MSRRFVFRNQEKFTEAQLQEIEDRVANLIQWPYTLLSAILDDEEDKEVRHNITLAIDDLNRLAQWVRGLRPTAERYRSNRCPRVRFGKR